MSSSQTQQAERGQQRQIAANEDQRRDEFEGHIGREMRLKVIEVDPKRRRLVMF